MKNKQINDVNSEELYTELENTESKRKKEEILFKAFCKTNNLDFLDYEIDNSEVFDIKSKTSDLENYEITSIMDPKMHMFKKWVISLANKYKNNPTFLADFISKKEGINDILNNYKGFYNPSILQGLWNQLCEKIQKLDKKYLEINDSQMKMPISILLWIDPIIDLSIFESNFSNLTIKELINNNIFPWININEMKTFMKKFCYHTVNAFKQENWKLSNIYFYFTYNKVMKSFKIWFPNMSHKKSDCKKIKQLINNMIIEEEPKKEVNRDTNKKIKKLNLEFSKNIKND